ncbi:MAG TPA: DNA polymerase I, partial [candidate division CPR3 bacterium]|nr:DNA polymerase I [candidate division CPR3 bacterium]
MKTKKKRLLVIDANSLIHRAYHALPPLTTSKGQQVNAVFGFLSVLFKVIKEIQPSYIAAAFDTAAPTKRVEKFKDYKGTRVRADDELYQQMPLVKEALDAFGIPYFEKDGWEADDVIGTIAKRTAKSNKIETIILTGDADAFQLVDETTKVYTMGKGFQDASLYGEKEVKARLGGLTPSQVVDYKGLRGDPSDNIPGVRGVGEKTAVHLLLQFGSMEKLYKALKKGEVEDVRPAALTALIKHKEDAFMSRDLASIDLDVPIEMSLNDLVWN